MKLSQRYIICFCLLLITSSWTDASLMHRRRNELAMLLAGGLLTLLFHEAAESSMLKLGHNVGHNVGHNLGSILGRHGNAHSIGGFNHQQVPRFDHTYRHHMPHPFAGLGPSHMLGGLGKHFTVPRHGHGGFNRHIPFSRMSHDVLGRHAVPFGLTHGGANMHHPHGGLPHFHSFSGFPVLPHFSYHNFPVLMHEPGLPFHHNTNIGHSFKNSAPANTAQHNNGLEDEELRQLLSDLEHQGLEPYSVHEAKFEDSSAPQHLDHQEHESDR